MEKKCSVTQDSGTLRIDYTSFIMQPGISWGTPWSNVIQKGITRQKGIIGLGVYRSILKYETKTCLVVIRKQSAQNRKGELCKSFQSNVQSVLNIFMVVPARMFHLFLLSNHAVASISDLVSMLTIMVKSSWVDIALLCWLSAESRGLEV